MYFGTTISFVVTGVLLASEIASADTQLVVQITCESDGRETAQGSGVLISGEGHVLTAKHVVPEGDTCWGSVGSVEDEKLPLAPLAQSFKYDGMVLKFDAAFEVFAQYCEMGDQMVKRGIHVWGFHPESVRGPSVTDGIISTFELDAGGMFETSAESVHGKSGGPAFLKDTQNIVGIVGGLKLNPSGFPVGYMVTPADKLAPIAPLVLSEDCVPTNYSLETHRAMLDELLEKIAARESQSDQQNQQLRQQLIEVEREKENLQASFEAREKRLLEVLDITRSIPALNDGQVSSERLEAAQEALYQGETALAKEIFVEIKKTDTEAGKSLAGAEYGLGIIAHDEFRWRDAYAHFVQAAKFNPSYEHLAWATKLAWQTGRYREGIDYGERMLEVGRAEFVAASADYSTALNLHGQNLYAQGHHQQAEIQFREALKIDATTVGESHENYGSSLNNLAKTLEATHQYEVAERLYRQALKINEEAIGKENPSYATSLANLAGLLWIQEKYAEAEQLHREALKIREAVLDKNHPDYASSLNHLALLLDDTENYDEAEKFYLKAINVVQTHIRKDHPYLAQSLHNYAELLFRRERFDDAERLFKEALDIRKAELGEGHPDYRLSLWSLAVFHWKQGDFGQAEPLFDKVVPAYEASLGPDHPQTKEARRQYEIFLKENADRSQ